MPRYLSIPIGLLMILGVLTGIGWFIFRTIARSDDPPKMLGKWILTFIILGLLAFMVFKEIGFSFGGAFIVPFICVAIGVIMSVIWAPHIGAFLAKPITALFDGGDLEVVPQPLYSMAIAKRKRGQYVEAIYRIREQLAKFPNDVTGQLMLAEILAEDMNDLPGAELTINRLCAQEGHAPESIAMAFNQLADWHLKYGRDLEAASQALQQIIDRFPGTEPAQLAHQRLAHLGRSDRRLQERGPIRVGVGQEDIGLMQDSSTLRAPEENPAAKAQEYVHHLEQFPQDAEIREKLAVIYAEHYKRLDLALAQLEELLQQPGQPTKLMAGWLNMVADLQVKYGDDYEGARQTLDRIVELYPGSAHAEKARQRMHYLRLTLKAKQVTDPIRLGAYETDLGLKAKVNPTDNPAGR